MPKKKVNTHWDALARELRSLIPQLNDEGLAFLVEQARVHLYNMQVDELNKSADAVNVASARSKSISGKPARSVSKGDNFRIDGTESGSSYYLHYKNDDAMFSRFEMIRLVKIVNAPGTDMEIRERLYNWFDRERRDIFAVLPISGKADTRLRTLAQMIRENFRLRK